MSLFTSLVFLLITLFINLSEETIKADGKAVLITGCDSGFGNQIAKRFNDLGFKVFATVMNPNSAGTQYLLQNSTFPHKMVIFQMDVTKEDEVNQAYAIVKQYLASSGHVLWALVNNAGKLSLSPLEWGTLDDYRSMFEVNVFGVVRMSRVFLPLIRKSKGRIININSYASLASLKNAGLYFMTKHSSLAFTEVLRREVSRFGIKVASIEPGRFETPMSASVNKLLELVSNRTSDEIKEVYGGYSAFLEHVTSLNSWIRGSLNLDIVVDSVIDAIVSNKPRPTYRPMDMIMKTVLAIHLYLPTKLVDFIMNQLSNIQEFVSLFD